MAEQTEQNSLSPSLSSPPALTKQLRAAYLLLGGEQQALFKKVFIWLWRYVQGQHMTGIVYNYWSADAFRVSHSLAPSELSLLSFLYMVSGRGVNTVRSEIVYNSLVCPGIQIQSIQAALSHIQKSGYINRTFRDPASPYLSENINKHKIFIRMTKPGIKLMRDFEYTINYNTMRSSLADIAERGKQGRTLNKKRDKT